MTRSLAWLGTPSLLVCLLLPAACKKKDGDGAAAPAKDSTGAQEPAGGGAAGGSGSAPTDSDRGGGTPGSDPAQGKFTLEEATQGLGGSGALMARISTSKGNLECTLFEKKTPITVASFVGLARGLRPWQDPNTRTWKKEPFFDGLSFHRVIPKFMIQGGDPISRNPRAPNQGTGGPGYELPDEFPAGLSFDRPGLMGMANAGPGTGGSQFFITEKPTMNLNGKHTIFGECAPLDVVTNIARVPRDADDKPNDPITMRVEIYRK
jgi:peptidyl-prolyl cis-trans isomerase A (cyclophilin A)